MLIVRRAAICIASTLPILALSACSTPTINGFNLSASPGSVALVPGETSYITVSAKATSTTAVTSAIVLYNLPAGVTASPASPTVTTGSETVIALTASNDAVVASNQVQVSGYAGLAYSDSLVTVAVISSK